MRERERQEERERKIELEGERERGKRKLFRSSKLLKNKIVRLCTKDE